MFRIVDEFDEPLGRQLVRQPLHALAACWPHLCDLRNGQWPEQREAAHEAKCTAAPTGDETGFLTERADPEEALCHFKHQLGDRCPLAVLGCPRPCPVSC